MSFGNAALCTHGFYGIFTRPDKGITTSLENVQHVMHVTGTSEGAISREKVDKKRNKGNKIYTYFLMEIQIFK